MAGSPNFADEILRVAWLERERGARVAKIPSKELKLKRIVADVKKGLVSRGFQGFRNLNVEERPMLLNEMREAMLKLNPMGDWRDNLERSSAGDAVDQNGLRRILKIGPDDLMKIISRLSSKSAHGSTGWDV